METEAAQTIVNINHAGADPADLGEIKRMLGELVEVVRTIASDLAFLARRG